ncbi:MAG TPA: hypothetical protein VK427_17055 [Kofleriaceae bacterium]|nr:hypothetical protein [Kofleriaceae bacterium]
MSIQINTWLRAYFALQSTAMESRGFVEINAGEDEAQRWPRTIGADVISIAALVDPFMREQPLRFGGHGLARRWRACVDDLEQHALVLPHAEYTENRSFWNTLPAVCVYLHSEGATLPPAMFWEALIAQLSEPVELRNVGPKGDGPFKHFDNVKTFDDLYNEQFKFLRTLRGVDHKDPEPGMGGANKQIPRTTNGDVVLLADYWSKQFRDVKEVFGHAAVAQRWKETLVDVDAIARKGDPNAVYPKNNGFWRALQSTAIHVAVADEAPSKSDMMLDSLKTSITQLPENLKAGAKAVANEVADIAGGAASAIGKVANEAGKGLFSGFGTPLLIGAGLVGLFLISRSGRDESAES